MTQAAPHHHDPITGYDVTAGVGSAMAMGGGIGIMATNDGNTTVGILVGVAGIITAVGTLLARWMEHKRLERQAKWERQGIVVQLREALVELKIDKERIDILEQTKESNLRRIIELEREVAAEQHLMTDHEKRLRQIADSGMFPVVKIDPPPDQP